jgi:hypothetical protein
MLHRVLPIAAIWFILLTSAALGGESTFSTTEKNGKTLSWRVVTSTSPTQPAVSYSLLDSSGQYRPVTDPAELSDLTRRTNELQAQLDKMNGLFNQTAEQRDQEMRDKFIAIESKYPPKRRHSRVDDTVGLFRLLIFLVSFGISGYVFISRWMRKPPPPRP